MFLDSNHSHFILIDDKALTSAQLTEKSSFDRELTVRGRLEADLRRGNLKNSNNEIKLKKYKSAEAISNISPDVSDDEASRAKEFEIKSIIPIVSIVLNGGSDCLLIVKENIIKKVPTLLLAGSKGVTDLICKVIALNELE